MKFLPERRQDIARLGLLLLVLAATYFTSFDLDFLIDDYNFLEGKYDAYFSHVLDYFVKNPAQHYIPVYYGLNTFLFHAFSSYPVAIRFCNLFLFFIFIVSSFYFVRSVTANSRVAMLACLFFLLHPYNADVVTYLTNSSIILGAIFLQQSSLFYWKSLQEASGQKTNYRLSLFTFLLALFCHEAYLLFPFYVLVLNRYSKRSSWKGSFRSIRPFLLMSAAYFLLWMKMAGGNSQWWYKVNDLHLTAGSFLLQFASLLGWYLRGIFIPDRVVYLFNITDTSALFGNATAFLIILAGLITLILGKGRELRRFSLLWFAVGFLLAIPGSFAHAYMGLVIEPNWVFFSSFGIFIFAAVILDGIKSKLPAWLWLTVVSVVVIYYFGATHAYLNIRKKVDTYAAYWVRINPRNSFALTTLADTYADKKDYENARKYYKRAVETSLYPSALVHYNLGAIELETGNALKAQEYFERGVDIDPNFALARLKLAVLHFENNDMAKAMEQIEKVLKQDASSASFIGIAKTFETNGALGMTALLLEQALKQFPRDKELYLYYGVVLANQGQLDRAIELWQEGQKLDPQDARFRQSIIQAEQLQHEKP